MIFGVFKPPNENAGMMDVFLGLSGIDEVCLFFTVRSVAWPAGSHNHGRKALNLDERSFPAISSDSLLLDLWKFGSVLKGDDVRASSGGVGEQ